MEQSVGVQVPPSTVLYYNFIMQEKNKDKNKKIKKPEIKIKGLNVDKAEYQEIILSNSNHPDRDCRR